MRTTRDRMVLRHRFDAPIDPALRSIVPPSTIATGDLAQHGNGH